MTSPAWRPRWRGRPATSPDVAQARAASIAWRALVKTARTPSPSSLASMGVPTCSRMRVRRAPSRSRGFSRKAVSPRRSVRAVESTMSAKRMMAVQERRGSGAATGWGSPTPRNSQIVFTTELVSEIRRQRRALEQHQTGVRYRGSETLCHLNRGKRQLTPVNHQGRHAHLREKVDHIEISARDHLGRGRLPGYGFPYERSESVSHIALFPTHARISQCLCHEFPVALPELR